LAAALYRQNKTVLAWNGFGTTASGYLTPLLSRIILVGEAALGATVAPLRVGDAVQKLLAVSARHARWGNC
jgi:hypothetical protein